MTGLYDVSPYLSGPWLGAALAGLGLVVGVLTGLFGVGGAFLITPLLSLLFGMHYQTAVASSLCYCIGAGAAGMARHARLGNVECKSMFLLGGGAICGALLGAMVNQALAGWLGDEGFRQTMDGLFVAVLALTAWLVFRGGSDDAHGRSLLQRLPLPPYVDLPAAKLTHVSLFGMCLAGLLIGLMGGLLGIGGGVLFVPLLILVVGLTPHLAVGTSLGVVLFGSVAGTIKYGASGKVNLAVAMALLVGSTVGVQIGAWCCQKLHARRLRRYFAVLVVIVAVILALRLAGGLRIG